MQLPAMNAILKGLNEVQRAAVQIIAPAHIITPKELELRLGMNSIRVKALLDYLNDIRMVNMTMSGDVTISYFGLLVFRLMND